MAVLDRTRKGRTFRRIAGEALTALLDGGELPADATEKPAAPAPGPDTPTVSAASADLETAGESAAVDTEGPADK